MRLPRRSAVAVHGGGEEFSAFAGVENGGIGAGADDCAIAHHVIVLLPDPAFVGQRGVRQQARKRGDWIHRRHGGDVKRGGRSPFRGFTMVNRCFVGEGGGGNFRHNGSILPNAHHAVVSDASDIGVGKIPFFKNFAHTILLALVNDDEHALLGFAEENFIRRHAIFALGDEAEINVNTVAAPTGRFAGRAGEAGGPHVLNARNSAACKQLQAGFKKKFFTERIADLHGRAILLGFLGEFP